MRFAELVQSQQHDLFIHLVPHLERHRVRDFHHIPVSVAFCPNGSGNSIEAPHDISF
jgi:hypothetical protein